MPLDDREYYREALREKAGQARRPSRGAFRLSPVLAQVGRRRERWPWVVGVALGLFLALLAWLAV